MNAIRVVAALAVFLGPSAFAHYQTTMVLSPPPPWAESEILRLEQSVHETARDNALECVDEFDQGGRGLVCRDSTASLTLGLGLDPEYPPYRITIMDLMSWTPSSQASAIEQEIRENLTTQFPSIGLESDSRRAWFPLGP
jgi:hypothetical protein